MTIDTEAGVFSSLAVARAFESVGLVDLRRNGSSTATTDPEGALAERGRVLELREHGTVSALVPVDSFRSRLDALDR